MASSVALEEGSLAAYVARAVGARGTRISARAADVLMFLLCRVATVDSAVATLPALRVSFQAEARGRIMRALNRLRPPVGTQVDPVRASIAVADMETALVVNALDLCALSAHEWEAQPATVSAMEKDWHALAVRADDMALGMVLATGDNQPLFVVAAIHLGLGLMEAPAGAIDGDPAGLWVSETVWLQRFSDAMRIHGSDKPPALPQLAVLVRTRISATEDFQRFPVTPYEFASLEAASKAYADNREAVLRTHATYALAFHVPALVTYTSITGTTAAAAAQAYDALCKMLHPVLAGNTVNFWSPQGMRAVQQFLAGYVRVHAVLPQVEARAELEKVVARLAASASGAGPSGVAGAQRKLPEGALAAILEIKRKVDAGHATQALLHAFQSDSAAVRHALLHTHSGKGKASSSDICVNALRPLSVLWQEAGAKLVRDMCPTGTVLSSVPVPLLAQMLAADLGTTLVGLHPFVTMARPNYARPPCSDAALLRGEDGYPTGDYMSFLRNKLHDVFASIHIYGLDKLVDVIEELRSSLL